MMSDRSYDVVLYGASGFVGQQTVPLGSIYMIQVKAIA